MQENKRIIKKAAEKFRRYLLNRKLFHGCETGNLKKVYCALRDGADVNAMIYAGRYMAGFDYSDTACYAYMSPLIIAASAARKNPNSRSYKRIVQLVLKQPSFNPEQVAKDVEIEYHPYGKIETYKTLRQVLTSSVRSAGRRCLLFSERNYPITDDMALFIARRQIALQRLAFSRERS